MLWAGQAMAQSSEGQVKPSLDPMPAVAPSQTVVKPAVEEETVVKKPVAFTGPRLNYNLSLGTSFSNGYGSASYVEPSVRYQVTDRFRAFVSMTYMAVSPYQYAVRTPEGGTMMLRSNASSHYIMGVGGEYLVNERLLVSGYLWKDFSNAPGANPYYNSFYSPGRQGVDIRATYKITERFTVTGGLRYTYGASPYYSPFGNPGFGGYQHHPFGY